MTNEEIRIAALNAAVRYNQALLDQNYPFIATERIIEDAKEFELFIKGEK